MLKRNPVRPCLQPSCLNGTGSAALPERLDCRKKRADENVNARRDVNGSKSAGGEYTTLVEISRSVMESEPLLPTKPPGKMPGHREYADYADIRGAASLPGIVL